MGPYPDPNQHDQPVPKSERSTTSHRDNDDTQPKLKATNSSRATSAREEARYQEPAYREHVTGSLAVPRSEAPNFAPAYRSYPAPQQQPYGQGQPPYPAYPVPPQSNPYSGYSGNGQQAYYGGYSNGHAQPYAPYGYYPGYGYPPYWYPYGWQPARPKRNGYQLTVSIIAFVGSILSLLTGLLCALFFLLIVVLPTASSMPADQRFGGLMEFFAFAVAGVVGGSFGLYHSIRALFMQKPSAPFKLPWFWTFLALYMVVIAIGSVLYFTGQSVASLPLTIFLISLAGILPAMTILSLGIRRIHFPRDAQWPTTWRRFSVALVSGATLAILLALIFELVLSVLVSRGLGLQNISLDNPDQPIPNDPRVIGFMFILVSVIAPLVEEAVKPLAVVVLIGRIKSAAEAFVLGLAAGIGFDLVETTGYMGMGYKSWLEVALQRSSAGLLHGFGAGMAALGWYFITHPKSTKKVNNVVLAFGCWGYALLQHAIWNGSFGLQLLPAPIGPYLDKGTIAVGPITFPSFLLVYVVESVLMLIFFFYVTKKLRTKNTPSAPIPEANGREESNVAGGQPVRNPQVVARATFR